MGEMAWFCAFCRCRICTDEAKREYEADHPSTAVPSPLAAVGLTACPNCGSEGLFIRANDVRWPLLRPIPMRVSELDAVEGLEAGELLCTFSYRDLVVEVRRRK